MIHRTPHVCPKPQPTERQFQRAVIQFARLCGWMVMHTRPALTKKGWRTPLQGDAGFPDLVLARAGWDLLLVELKRTGQKRRPDQLLWAASIPDENYRFWTMDDWSEIEFELRRKAVTTTGRC